MRIGHFILFIFILIPLIEVYLLVAVGSAIGALPTIGLIILTAVTGVWLLQLQSLHALQRAQDAINAGKAPTASIMEGLFLVIAGLLLITPGFFTDALGFLCLLPPLRDPLMRWAFSYLSQYIQGQAANAASSYSRPHRPTVLEGKYRREE